MSELPTSKHSGQTKADYKHKRVRPITFAYYFSGQNLTIYEFLKDRIVCSKSWSIGIAKPIQHVSLA